MNIVEAPVWETESAGQAALLPLHTSRCSRTPGWTFKTDFNVKWEFKCDQSKQMSTSISNENWNPASQNRFQCRMKIQTRPIKRDVNVKYRFKSNQSKQMSILKSNENSKQMSMSNLASQSWEFLDWEATSLTKSSFMLTYQRRKVIWWFRGDVNQILNHNLWVGAPVFTKTDEFSENFRRTGWGNFRSITFHCRFLCWKTENFGHNFGKKSQYFFRKRGQRPFRNFPKIYPFWWIQASLILRSKVVRRRKVILVVMSSFKLTSTSSTLPRLTVMSCSKSLFQKLYP